MLHHHLPPWAVLRQRLKVIATAGRSKSSKRDLVTLSKDSSSTHLHQNYYQREELHINGLGSSAEHELENLKSVRSYVNGADLEAFDDDRIYLKHDPHHD